MLDDCAFRECDESRGTRYSERHTAQNGRVRSVPTGSVDFAREGVARAEKLDAKTRSEIASEAAAVR
jgi:hypothetical protein